MEAGVTYVISEPCIDVKDKSCIEECPVDCIYEGDRMLYIHPDECVDCGACEPVCPVEAIFYEDDIPAQWKDFTAANATFFTEGEEPLGSPGGAPRSAQCCATPSSSPTIRSQRPEPRPLHAGGWAPRRSGRPCGQGLANPVCGFRWVVTPVRFAVTPSPPRTGV
jgi:NAD-dependent dihydropyrimidine dehydrogenase PreA subunit